LTLGWVNRQEATGEGQHKGFCGSVCRRRRRHSSLEQGHLVPYNTDLTNQVHTVSDIVTFARALLPTHALLSTRLRQVLPVPGVLHGDALADSQWQFLRIAATKLLSTGSLDKHRKCVVESVSELACVQLGPPVACVRAGRQGMAVPSFLPSSTKILVHLTSIRSRPDTLPVAGRTSDQRPFRTSARLICPEIIQKQLLCGSTATSGTMLPALQPLYSLPQFILVMLADPEGTVTTLECFAKDPWT